MIAARTKLGLETLAAGLALGIAGDTLLRAMPWGLNVTLCAAALVAAGTILVRRNNLSPSPDAPWLALTVLLLGAAFMRRDSEALAQFDVLGLILALALGAASLHGERIAALRPLEYLRAGVTAATGTITGSLVLVGHDVQWHELPRGGRARRVGLGVLLATPFLVLFGALFSSADTVFANVLQNLFAFDLKSVVSHGLQIAFWAAVTAGYLRWGLLARPAAWTFADATPKLGIVPVATALGLLDMLFLVFVIVQLRYFFGGATLVEETTGLTYSEYARRGFFELVTASALVLPVLHGADHLVRGETPEHLRTFRRLAGILLVLLAVVMASALERMRLYVAAYGLSESRLYATAFMVLLLGVFAWFAWTVLRGLPQRFAFGALIQGFVVLAGLHVLNPDAFIARTNLNRPAAERPFDAKYATSLGADAVPPLLHALPSLGETERCAVASALLRRWGQGDADWRTWNWSRARARRLVSGQANALRALTCPPTSSSE
jgi:predicted transporter